MQDNSAIARCDHDCIQAFLDAPSQAERNQLLEQDRAFWDQEGVQTKIDADVLPIVVEHIACNCDPQVLEESYGDAFHIHRQVGFVWTQPTLWLQWQRRIFELKHALDWPRMQSLIRIVFGAQMFSGGPHIIALLEESLAHGMEWPIKTVVDAVHSTASQQPKLDAFFANIPCIKKTLCSTESKEMLVGLALSDSKYLHWLPRLHVELNPWTIGDASTDEKVLRSIASTLADQALFKAWHGLPLSLEEAQMYPVAQSIYINKHAPALWSDAVALPEHCVFALEMAATGAQFKALMLQARGSKGQESLKLPEHLE